MNAPAFCTHCRTAVADSEILRHRHDFCRVFGCALGDRHSGRCEPRETAW